MSFQPSHILVPVAVLTDDDMRLAKFAARSAWDIADAMGARVTLYYAGPDVHDLMSPYPGVPGATSNVMHRVVTERLEHVRRRLETLRKELESEGQVVRIEIGEAHGESVPQAIARAVVELGVDLVVVPSHGRKGVERLLLGSVAERVAHVVESPVLLLRLPKDCC